MEIKRCVVTGKENGHYHVSFTVEKNGTNHAVLANYIVHDISIVTSDIAFNPREKQKLAGFARRAKEEWESQNI